MTMEPLTEHEWDVICSDVAKRMTDHVNSYTIALHEVVSHDLGMPAGTGTYLHLRGKSYVLTNEHVAELVLKGGLAHQPREGDFAHRSVHPFMTVPAPVDAAISRVDDESWGGSTKLALPAQ